ncbi:MAG: ribbon-helix-helix protein, CopG family [Clostridia bacterium]|nr:ribbon-helix-helix protein, CopG family [Clostridia bacterium]MBQ3553374.1 ribbon-helix-helix protein, CopG family [Clostridia bacterium]
MSQLRKVLITVPDSLLAQVDDCVGRENLSRSEFVREAMRHYLEEKQKAALKEEMQKGYQEMAELNLSIAAMCFEAEEEAFSAYEEKLAECE